MRSLLAYLPTYPRAATAAFPSSVAAVAGKFGARVRAAVTRPVFKDPSNWALSHLLRDVTQDATRRAAQHEATLTDAMRDAARQAGVQLEMRTIEGDPLDFEHVMRRWSRVHDLTMIELDEHDLERGVAEVVVFGSGRPLLVLPVGQTRPFSPDKIVVAWDGGAAAARALGDALPWLIAADRVQLVAVSEDGKLQPGARAEEAVDLLAGHDVEVELVKLEAKDRKIDAVLFDHALGEGADLVVMGAYGHSRVREFVLGSVTCRALDAPRLPILLSH